MECCSHNFLMIFTLMLYIFFVFFYYHIHMILHRYVFMLLCIIFWILIIIHYSFPFNSTFNIASKLFYLYLLSFIAQCSHVWFTERKKCWEKKIIYTAKKHFSLLFSLSLCVVALISRLSGMIKHSWEKISSYKK